MKNQIRKTFKELRKNTPCDIINTLSNQAQDMFLSSELYNNAENIMVYMPICKETDTKKIISRCFADNKRVLLPVTKDDEITAKIFTPDTKTEKGAYSITEPTDSDDFDKSEIDLVIVPGIAFSKNGGRIGFGKGCYDRFLKDTKAIRMGLCYEFQLTDEIILESHDIPMDYIVTDKSIYNYFAPKEV